MIQYLQVKKGLENDRPEIETTSFNNIVFDPNGQPSLACLNQVTSTNIFPTTASALIFYMHRLEGGGQIMSQSDIMALDKDGTFPKTLITGQPALREPGGEAMDARFRAIVVQPATGLSPFTNDKRGPANIRFSVVLDRTPLDRLDIPVQPGKHTLMKIEYKNKADEKITGALVHTDFNNPILALHAIGVQILGYIRNLPSYFKYRHTDIADLPQEIIDRMRGDAYSILSQIKSIKAFPVNIDDNGKVIPRREELVSLLT